MNTHELTAAAERGAATIAGIVADAGIDLKDCYQCGKCSAGCPVDAEADMTCREVIRNLQLGLVEPVLRSTMPWLCLHCGTCVARCPQKVDLPSLNRAIRDEAKRRGIVPVKETDVFDSVFIGNVEKKGVSDEAMLAAFYNLKTGHLFQDVSNAPTMKKKGLMSGDGHKPADMSEIKRIFEKGGERK